MLGIYFAGIWAVRKKKWCGSQDFTSWEPPITNVRSESFQWQKGGWTHFSCSFFKFCSKATLLWYKQPAKGRTTAFEVFISQRVAPCLCFSPYLVWSFPSLCFCVWPRPHWRKEVVILSTLSDSHTHSGKALWGSLHWTGYIHKKKVKKRNMRYVCQYTTAISSDHEFILWIMPLLWLYVQLFCCCLFLKKQVKWIFNSNIAVCFFILFCPIWNSNNAQFIGQMCITLCC